MNLINAEIKSKEELITRLMAGEVFYTKHGDKVYYDKDAKYNPFLIKIGADIQYLRDPFGDFAELRKEPDWWDIVEFPVVCKRSFTEGECGIIESCFVTIASKGELVNYDVKSLIPINWKKW